MFVYKKSLGFKNSGCRFGFKLPIWFVQQKSEGKKDIFKKTKCTKKIFSIKSEGAKAIFLISVGATAPTKAMI